MYERLIRESAARQGHLGANPRHIEAWMRLEHSELDGLTVAQFNSEVLVAIACIDAAAPGQTESLARSMGLAS